ncbi:MAG: 1-(5-phosphoribosyl)-5-[(5-phosphoribosylamino)methylideneamino]imidazole-4-carboxamide isomerase [Spirochaetota bacterium]
MLQVIPAIDILNGKVVRLYQGSYDAVTEYGDDPAEQAEAFVKAGAARIHIVDLNGAREGTTVNASVIEDMRRRVSCTLEVGGGIRTMKDIKRYADIGIDHLILGTKAIIDIDFLENAVRTYGERIITGLDVKDGKPAVGGWYDIVENSVEVLLREYERIGVRTVIHTDIRSDGAFTGISADAVRSFLSKTTIQVIISGGVASISDIRTLMGIDTPNLLGVITGKAIYDGRLSLEEALLLTRNGG